jgi:4'-phosphopantetheinyl transferase
MTDWSLANPTAPPPLDADDLAVWVFSLAESGDDCILSVPERQRAARLHRDRRRFIAARAGLRRLLGGYLGQAPEEICLGETEAGKPVLADPLPNLHFNLSHSDDVMVIAVTRLGPVGIDVERRERFAEMDGVIDQICAPAEAGRVRAGGVAAFSACWTRKEAFVKALGVGFSFDPRRVEVTAAPDEPARLVAIDGDPAAIAAWWMAGFSPYSAYDCAVCVAAAPERLQLFRAER